MPSRKKKPSSKELKLVPEKPQSEQPAVPTPLTSIPDPNLRPSLTSIASQLSDQQTQAIVKDLQQLCSQVKEFLGTFLILGYTLDGLPVQVIYSKTQLEQDALHAALSRFLLGQGRLTAPPDDGDQTPEPHDEPH